MNNVSITNYADFANWHNLNHGSAYLTPAFDAIKVDFKRMGKTYDSEKGLFYFFTGQFHPTPFVRIDVPWTEVAKHYEGMYSDFARYGCD